MNPLLEFAVRCRAAALIWMQGSPGLLEYFCPVTARWRREGYHPGTYQASS